MISVRPKLFRCLVAALASVGFAATNACAQDDLVAEEGLEIDRNDDRARLLDQARQFQIEQQRQRLQATYQSQFERWVVSQFQTEDGARRQLEMLLTARVRQLTAQCRLTDEQSRKLELAGRGDIKRFMDRFEYVSRTIQDPKSSIDDIRAAGSELRALRMPARERLFGENSLLGKTLAGTLDQQQSAAHRKVIAAKNRAWHEAAIETAVSTMQSNLSLTDEQRRTLAKLLRNETKPPRRFGEAPDIALVLFQASQIPEDKIRPIFDDSQWQVMRRWMSVYIDRSAGKDTLVNHGFVFDDEPAAGGVDREKKVATRRSPPGDRTD